MAFANACRCDFDEFGLVFHVFNGCAAAVTHAGSHAACHLVHDADHRAFVGHAAFNAFGDQFVGVRVASARFLEVTIRAALRHGANRAHASVAFVAAPLVEDDFPWRFFGARKHAAHHDA